MELGIHKNIPNDDYQNYEAISRSDICKVLQSPLHFKETERKETEALKDGNFIHFALSEPEKIADLYYRMPKCDRRTTVGKEAFKEHLRVANGRDCLVEEKYDGYLKLSKKVCLKPIINNLLHLGSKEITAIAEINGVKCKARADLMIINKTDDKLKGTIVDWKTTEDARYHPFRRCIERYRWNLQCAWYLQVFNAAMPEVEFDEFIFGALEKSAPYESMLYRASEEMIEDGWAECLKGLHLYKTCLDKNEWPGYSNNIETMYIYGD